MEIFTPHTRGLIVRRLAEGREWQGTRGPLRLVFRVSAQPTLEGARVEWRARIAGRWHSGAAGTVAEAEQEIDAARRSELRQIGELIGEHLRGVDLLKGKPK